MGCASSRIAPERTVGSMMRCVARLQWMPVWDRGGAGRLGGSTGGHRADGGRDGASGSKPDPRRRRAARQGQVFSAVLLHLRPRPTRRSARYPIIPADDRRQRADATGEDGTRRGSWSGWEPLSSPAPARAWAGPRPALSAPADRVGAAARGRGRGSRRVRPRLPRRVGAVAILRMWLIGRRSRPRLERGRGGALGPIDVWINDAMTSIFAPVWEG